MPKSVSADQGKTWTSGPSDFPWITFVQRPVLLRLEHSHPALDPQGRGRRPLLPIKRVLSDGRLHYAFNLAWLAGKS
jgi:hypothetical protein